jgi:1,4-dihydroxy-2-naphthoate octaprenyltransferase
MRVIITQRLSQTGDRPDRRKTMAMENDVLRKKVGEILEESSSFTLASGSGDSVWAAAFYFVADGEALCFVTKPDSRTLRNLKDSPRVAFTIAGAGRDGSLQGAGRATLLGPVDEAPSLKERLLSRNPALAQLIEKIPNCQLVKLVVEAYYLTDMAEGTLPREELLTAAAHDKPSSFALWGRAVRAFSFTASIIPPTVGAMLAFLHEIPTRWALFPLVLVASVFFHAGTNLVNDYYDFKNNVDRRGTLGSSGLLVQGLISARAIMRGAVVFFGLGTLIGLYFVSVRGVPILILGAAGLLGGYFYTGGPIGYKYRAMGEPLVFMLMGPLMVVGSYLVLTGAFGWDVVLISLPVGCLVAAILQSNNLRDIADDSKVGVKTTAIILGRKAAGVEYFALVLAAYVIVGVLAAVKMVPVWSLAVLVTLPAATRNLKIVRKMAAGPTRQYGAIDVQTAQLHMAFGVVLILSLAAGRLL